MIYVHIFTNYIHLEKMTHPLEAKKSRKQIPFTTSFKNAH